METSKEGVQTHVISPYTLMTFLQSSIYKWLHLKFPFKNKKQKCYSLQMNSENKT